MNDKSEAPERVDIWIQGLIRELRNEGYLVPYPIMSKAVQAHADQVVRDMAQPVTQEAAARVLLKAVDAFMDGDKLTDAQNELQKSAFIAGSFAGAAYDTHVPKSGGEYHALTRAFLLALIDPTHEDLDYLRADPSSGSAARKASDALRAIATPPQENALQELADLGQEFDAERTNPMTNEQTEKE